MALGDGIRRNFALITDEERDLFIAAIRKMDDPLSTFVFPNNAGHEGADAAGNITFWDMQEQIHKDAHVHGSNVHFGPGFIPWHRALCNHMESLLRQVDSRLSLHYWDWTTDPRAAPPGGVVLFTHQTMGDDGHGGINRVPADGGGDAGDPFADFETTEGGGHNFIWRNVAAQAAKPDGTPDLASDSGILSNTDFTSFATALKAAHDNTAHSYIGGTIIDPHYSFHDPFVFLLHSNLDRIWAIWQRQPGHADRLNPATAYGTIATDEGFPADYFDEWVQPWAGVDRNGVLQTDLNPWASDPSSREQIAYNDPAVVTPPSYDTVPHTSYFVTDRSTFSADEVASQAAYPGALSLFYDGFTPNELGGVPPTAPTAQVTFDSLGGPDASGAISVAFGPALLENNGADTPQRVTFPVNITFTDPTVFNGFVDTRMVHIRATHGTDHTDAAIKLLKQPNPYMLDGPVSWLSTDVRVFNLTPGNSLPFSATVQGDVGGPDPHPAITYIQALLGELPDGNAQAFDNLPTDQQASALEPSQTVGATPVFNYAVAKVRYRANTVPADNVQVFFRTFSTLRSALDYTYAGGPPTINYPRSGTSPNAVPLLGVIDSEIASIPYFAVDRVDTTAFPMTAQPVDAPNVQTITAAAGQEAEMFFGCWLDFNQPTDRFPLSPSGVGPYSNAQPIPAIINGLHQCLVAEIRFQPGATDPIPTGSTPASSDHLSQRNVAFTGSSNPGGGASHTVQHSFVLRPSLVIELPRLEVAAAEAVPAKTTRGRSARGKAKSAEAEAAVITERGWTELQVRWNNVPRTATATIFLPECDADAILELDAARQHPRVLHKVDQHTLRVDVAPVTYITIPPHVRHSIAGLLTLELPKGVRIGQTYTVDFHQFYRGPNRFNGAFRIAIHVEDDPALLRTETRHLALLRYIRAHRTPADRWYPILEHWIDGLVHKVRALGGDPDPVPPSLPDPRYGGYGGPGGHHDEVHVTGRVVNVFYDCFGVFEGFATVDCDCEHRFRCTDPGIERIVYRACVDQTLLTVHTDLDNDKVWGVRVDRR
jgi:hypothetical protein